MHYCPDSVLDIFKKKFAFPDKPLFGVVSSRREMGINTRMMRIYDINENGQLILLTHTGAQKWKEFSNDLHLSICFVSDDKLTQVIMRGKASLETQAAQYWGTIREDVKQLYDPAYAADQPYQEHPPLIVPKIVPETSGMVTCSPDFWEILELVLPYTESKRMQFHLSASGWSETRMSLG